VKRTLDSNGVQLVRGMRVRQTKAPNVDAAGAREIAPREGYVAALVGLAGVFVLWDGEQDDEYVDARFLTTVSAVRSGRRR
jgi:hypothetical protein